MTSLKALYEAHLANLNAPALSEDSSLNYITTLTTINTAAAITRHHAAHQKVLKKKEEKILSCIEGHNGLCLDVETTIEFLAGGGAYLPGLDDNFLADRVVTFPIVHIVHFDASQKIRQIRLYWDQGSLLKLVDVIGARARNWPIRDGKDQARLIISSATALAQSSSISRPSTASSATDTSRDAVATPNTHKPRSQSKNVTRDPHASLQLFAPQEEDASTQVIAPRAAKAQSANPQPRDYHDLFVGNESDASPQDTKFRTISPTKEDSNIRAQKSQSAKPPARAYNDLFVSNAPDPSIPGGQAAFPQNESMTPGPIAPKAGAGKNFKPSRLFETEDSHPGTPGSPEKSSDVQYKAHPQKYNHFEFGDHDEASQPVAARPKSKHQSNWDFEDFMTPEKAPTKIRSQDVRHFGWNDDEPIMESPAKHPAIAKARPDARSNFDFQDDGTPGDKRRPAGNPRGMGNVKGTGLYQNNVFDEESSTSPEKKQHPLATVTNLKDRRKDFVPHFSMTDESPSSNGKKQQPPIPEARAKVVNDMKAQWEATDISPASRDKENFQNGDAKKRSTGIKTGGDGMGGRKGGVRSWGFGDESDEDGVGGANGGKFQASKIQQAPKDNTFWDF